MMMSKLRFALGWATVSIATIAGSMALSTSAATPPPRAQVAAAPLYTKSLPAPMKVYGDESSQALADGIAYWNNLAGAQILRFELVTPATEMDAHAAQVKVAPLDGYAGVASGWKGETLIEITIDPEYAHHWNVYAHELGHALGFDDYNTDQAGIGITDTSYRGIMSYGHVDNPTWAHDERLLVS